MWPGRRRTLVVGGAVLLLAVLLVGAYLATRPASAGREADGATDGAGPSSPSATGGSASTAASPRGTPSPRPGVAPTVKPAPAPVVSAIAEVVQAASGALGSPRTGTTAELRRYAGPELRQAILNQQAEFAANQWRQVGTPRIVTADVVKSRGTDVVVRACVDVRDVRVVDRAGRPVAMGARPDRALHLYSLSRTGGRWLVTGETFPDNPSC